MNIKSAPSVDLLNNLQGCGKIGLFFANGIGDHLITLPAIRAIADRFRERTILFANLWLANLFFGGVTLGSIIDVTLHEDRHGRNRFSCTPLAERVSDLMLFISINPWHSTQVDALLARLRPSRSVGMFEQFDICVQPCSGEHSCDRAFQVARAIDPKWRIEDYSNPPMLPKESLLSAYRMLAGIHPGQKVLAVHNETSAHKVWRHERMARVIELFLKGHREFVVLALGPTNEGFGAFVGNPRVMAPAGLPLDAALALVAQADLFLGIDSCMLHMADMCRVPGVGLFGPGDSAPLGSHEMGFRFGPHRHVTGNGHMDGIAAERVLAALTELNPGIGAIPRRQTPAFAS